MDPLVPSLNKILCRKFHTFPRHTTPTNKYLPQETTTTVKLSANVHDQDGLARNELLRMNEAELLETKLLDARMQGPVGCVN